MITFKCIRPSCAVVTLASTPTSLHLPEPSGPHATWTQTQILDEAAREWTMWLPVPIVYTNHKPACRRGETY